ncbi:WYL domain-containing protein [Pontibacter arcticus]|uniref:Uncharacterized protein n=1 Tax=Pontibacter arcticus TaxID=2080288 RepID=A0A364RBN5_9BACT|nr:WYL domain-containing protein [Pontibacter arcticus]RAU81576.1 hypothetical protein DP923_15860 [Pontibacter arcticus]
MYSHLLEHLSEAIGARLLVQFEYHSETYVVEPYLLGTNTAKQDCLYAWYVGKEKEGWRCFCLANLKNVVLLTERFSAKRPGYEPYNNLMSRIYYRV